MTSPATLAVSFDQKEIAPGDVITGRVFLSVSQSELACTAIGCRVFGQERTSVLYSTTSYSGDEKTTHFHTAQDTRTFVDFPFSAHRFPNGKVLAGHYEVPFQFTMPHDCPASLTAGDPHSHCAIQYHMEVRLGHPGVMKWDIRHQQEFTVVDCAATSAKTPLCLEPSTSELRTMGLVSRGNVVIGSMVENCTLVAGESTVVKYAVQNQSSLHVKAVKVSLVEVVSFRAQGQSTTQTTKLFRKRIVVRDCPLDLSPLRGTAMDEEQALRAMNEVLRGDTTNLQLIVPLTAKSHYAGALISVTHELVIKVCTPFGTSNPQVSRPVYVYSRGAPIAAHQAIAQAVALPTIARAAEVPHEDEKYHAKLAHQVYATVVSRVASAESAVPALVVAQRLSEKVE